MQKRSLSIQGHRTSITLEAIFWESLKHAAIHRETSISQLVAQIDAERTTGLSSAIRVWLMQQALRGVLTADNIKTHREQDNQKKGENA
jgi:predicted DNA-binding ribbon-helix-helix protein